MHTLEVENLKCSGCAGSIQKGLSVIVGVSDISIDIETKTIEFNSDKDIAEHVKHKLGQMGYPEKGKGTGFQKVKSYVSCAIGKIDN